MNFIIHLYIVTYFTKEASSYFLRILSLKDMNSQLKKVSLFRYYIMLS